MKTFGKIKLLLLFATIALGMTSCLKSSDPEFQFGVSAAYIEQRGSGTTATFTPMFQIYAYEAIQKASVANTNNLYFTSQHLDAEKLFMDLVSIESRDSIPNGVYTINATNAEQEVASLSLTFSINKRLGAFTVNSVDYKDGKIKASWEEVAGADAYYFLMREGRSKVWRIYNWNGGTGAAKKEGTYSLELFKEGTELEVAVAAGYRNLIVVGGAKSIIVGTYDNEEENPAD